MSKITNDGLTWSDTGCFIAVPMWQRWVCEGLCWLTDRLLVQAEDGDSDDEAVEEEETALESYETPLDKDDCPVDEYQVFKAVLESQ